MVSASGLHEESAVEEQDRHGGNEVVEMDSHAATVIERYCVQVLGTL